VHCRWRLLKIYHFREDSNEIHHDQFVDGHLPIEEVRHSQATSLWPDNFLLNVAFEGEVSITFAIVSPL
jgi:hypothetical protein